MSNKKVPDLLKVEGSLGPLESEVMEVVWSKNKASVNEVIEVVRRKRQIAYTTIMTVMNNLYKKEYLTRRKVGKAYQYRTVAPKSIFLKNALLSVIHDLIISYGRARVLLATLRLDISPARQFRVATTLETTVSQHKTPVWYGVSFTLLAASLVYSVWDLLQNLTFFGTIHYLRLALSEPTLILNRFDIVASALIESLPTLNVLATIILLSLFIFVGKKLIRLLDIRVFPRLGGVV